MSITISGPAIWAVGGAGVAQAVPYGAQIFANDHLSGAIAAAFEGSSPYSASYSAVVQIANSYSGHASSRTTIANLNSPALPTSVFGSPAAGSSQGGLAFTIDTAFAADMSAAYSTALSGFIQNKNAPTAMSLVRDWCTGTLSIASFDIPAGFGGSDGPLVMNTTGPGVILAAILFDEALAGNWSNLSGWTQADRTHVESFIVNTWVSSSLIVVGLSPAGNAPNNNMQNNWRSHACNTMAIGGFYLLNSSNPTNVALGQTYISQSAALIAGYMTGSITNTHDTQVGQPFIVQNSGTLSAGMLADPGDITTEDERGIDVMSYTMFSMRSLLSAMQVIQAAGGPNLFAQYSTTVELILNTLLDHVEVSPTFYDCYTGGAVNAYPYSGSEFYEAAGAYLSQSSYTTYATLDRISSGIGSTWKQTMAGQSGQGAIGVHSFSTLTSLLQPQVVSTIANYSAAIYGNGLLTTSSSIVSSSGGGGGGGGGGGTSGSGFVFTFPNIPSGWTWTSNGVTHKRNIAVGANDGRDPNGNADWGDIGVNGGGIPSSNNETVTNDTTAPFSGTLGKFGLTGNWPTVMGILYPAGLGGGASSINEWIIGPLPTSKFTKCYSVWAVKIPSTFVFTADQLNKFFYWCTSLQGGSNASMIVGAERDNASNGQASAGGTVWNAFMADQSPGPEANRFNNNVAPYNGGKNSAGTVNYNMAFDKWYIFEAYIQMNSPGATANGIFQLWVTDPATGITTALISYNNVHMTSQDGDYFGEWNWQPVYGGGGSSCPQNQYMYWNDFYLFAST